MEIKLLEIRDRGTTVPAMAIRLLGRDEAERWLLDRAGYYGPRAEPTAAEPYVLLTKLVDDLQTQYAPFHWRPAAARTMPVAHRHVIEHWREVSSGDVVDVEFILGERSEPKVSERLVRS